MSTVTKEVDSFGLSQEEVQAIIDQEAERIEEEKKQKEKPRPSTARVQLKSGITESKVAELLREAAKRKQSGLKQSGMPTKPRPVVDLTDVTQEKKGLKSSNLQLLNLFLQTPVSDHEPRDLTGNVDCVKEGPVMCVQIDETLPRVFRKFAVENFLSAPVLEGRTYVGFVSVLDLVKKTTELFWGQTEQEWLTFWDKQDDFANTTVRDIIDFPDEYMRDPYPPLDEKSTTFYALELMALTGRHRFAFVNEQTRVTGILTQSMLISWLTQNKRLMPDICSRPVRDMISYKSSKELVSIEETDIAINAFRRMLDAGVTGVAVVNKSKQLVGSMSLRDLRGVGTSGSHFSRLFIPVCDFKEKVLEEYPNQAPDTHETGSKKVPFKGLYVIPQSTIEDVLEMMNDGNLHRIYVCDTESARIGKPKPIGVISQKDILCEVLNELTQRSL